MALLSRHPGTLQAWKTALNLLPGRLRGTCRDLLRVGMGERKNGFEGKVKRKM